MVHGSLFVVYWFIVHCSWLILVVGPGLSLDFASPMIAAYIVCLSPPAGGLSFAFWQTWVYYSINSDKMQLKNGTN